MTLFASFRVEPIGGPILRAPQLFDSDPSFAPKLILPGHASPRAHGRHVLLAIHGFNVKRAAGVASLGRLDARLGLGGEALFIGVLWPGDSRIGALGYAREKPTAQTTGRHLASFCNTHLKEAASISLVAHSLGARVALEAVRRLNRKAEMVCLLAAAIERSCLTQEYRDAFANAARISVLASREDGVLRLAFPLGNLIAHAMDPTANPLSGALGYAGPPGPIGNTVPPWQIDPAQRYDHGDYFPDGDAAHAYPAEEDQTGQPIEFIKRCFLKQAHAWP
ncbi:alpha/beta hydrolase [Arvimicrobium flavum]|uniref:alpha/beta hydrolase n=1 Tax=Arvimicrobium flavum TaxID=3393320 RepID=UPI00237AB60C|nr:alpha/beta hydrolase [Mesorhizobium shangrilense]